jgi:hypothetical protein
MAPWIAGVEFSGPLAFETEPMRSRRAGECQTIGRHRVAEVVCVAGSRESLTRGHACGARFAVQRRAAIRLRP